MPYDEMLERRVDAIVADTNMVLTKSKMFGCMAYFAKGDMCFAIMGEVLLVRSKPEGVDELLHIPGTHEAQMGARKMKGWIMAGGQAIATEADVQKMLQMGFYRATELPPKDTNGN